MEPTSLHRWAERYLKDVTEDGECTHRVRMATPDGTTWETWERPFGSPQDWADNAQTTLAELLPEWPCQSIQVLFIAEDSKGIARAQQVRSVRGKNKESQTFGGQGKALTDSMANQAATMAKILETANVQLDSCRQSIEAQAEALRDAYTYIRLKNEQEATQLPSPTKEAAATLMNQFGENLPLILDLLKGLKLKAMKDGALGNAVQGAVAGVLQGTGTK